MQDMKTYGSDQESRKSRIGIFSGESTGTAMPFATYKDNFRRLAQNEGATTSINILFGKYDTYLYATDTATIDEVWNDLIVWPGARYPHDSYIWTDEIYTYTDVGINHLDVITKKVATVHFNRILDTTSGMARDEALLYELNPNPLERLKLTWDALNKRFDDYPAYVVLALKHRLENLYTYTVKEPVGDAPGVYRAWRPGDALETYFVKLESLRSEYLRVTKKAPDAHDPAETEWEGIIDKIIDTIDGYQTFEMATNAYKLLAPNERTYPKFKNMVIERAKKIARQSAVEKARRVGSTAPPTLGTFVVNTTKGRCRFAENHDKCSFGDRCIFDYDGKSTDGGGHGGRDRGRGRGTARDTGKKVKYTADGMERCMKYESTGGCDFETKTGKSCKYAHVNASGKTVNQPTATKVTRQGGGGGGGGGGKGGGKGKRNGRNLNTNPNAKQTTADFEKKAGVLAEDRFDAFMVKLQEQNADSELLNSIEMPSFPVHFGNTAFNTGSILDLWNNGIRFGVDTDAGGNVTCYGDQLVNLRTIDPVKTGGFGGGSKEITQMGDWPLRFRTATGQTVLLLIPFYLHPEAGANIISAQWLHTIGWDCVMGHATRNSLKTTSNSPHAILGPSGQVIWLHITGASETQNGILTIDRIEGHTQGEDLPVDIAHRMYHRVNTLILTGKQKKRKAAQIAYVAQMSAAEATLDDTKSPDMVPKRAVRFKSDDEDNATMDVTAANAVTADKKDSTTASAPNAAGQIVPDRHDGGEEEITSYCYNIFDEGGPMVAANESTASAADTNHWSQPTENLTDENFFACSTALVADMVILNIAASLAHPSATPKTMGSFKYTGTTLSTTQTPHDTAIKKSTKTKAKPTTSDAPHDKNHDDDEHIILDNIIQFNYSQLTALQRTRLWLRRLGYPGSKELKKMNDSKVAIGVQAKSNLATEDDPIAAMGRFRAAPYKKSRTDHAKSIDPGHTWSTDHVSGFKTKSIHGATGAFISVCIASNFVIVHLVRARSEFPLVLKKLHDSVQSWGRKMCRYRSDSAPEIIGGNAAKIAADHDIISEPSSNKSPMAGGKHESAVGRVVSKARTLLATAPWMGKNAWALALMYAALLINVSTSTTNEGGAAPYTLMTGRIPDLINMGIRTWGCVCHYGLSKIERAAARMGKLEPLTIACYFAGFSGNLILLLYRGKILTGQRQKCAFYEGCFTQRYTPRDPTPDALHDDTTEAHTDAKATTPGHDNDNGDMSTSSDEEGDDIRVVRSEQSSKPPIDIITRVVKDFEGVKIGNEIDELKINDPTDTGIQDQGSSNASDTSTGDGGATADTTAAREGTDPYQGTKTKYDDKYNGATVPVDGESDAAVVINSASMNTTNDDYEKFPISKRWGVTLQYESGDQLWKPLVDGALGVSRIATLATGADASTSTSTSTSTATRKSTRSTRYTTPSLLTFLTGMFVTSASDKKITNAQLKNLPNPKSIWDCVQAPDYRGWHTAARSEYLSWLKLGVFKVIDKAARLPGLSSFPLQDVWTRKFNPSGEFSKFKLRLCIMGQLMARDGIDCAKNVYAPTIGATAVRLFFALAAQSGFTVSSLDVCTAYLTAEASGRFYCLYPTVFRFAQLSADELERLRHDITNSKGEKLAALKARWRTKFAPRDPQCLKLLKSVYGHPAAGAMFWKHWRTIMLFIGMKQSKIEACFFYKRFDGGDEDPLTQQRTKHRHGRYVFVISFVDDAAIAGDDESKRWFISEIKKYLPITTETPITSFLGMTVNIDLEKNFIELTASGMIDAAMERFRQHVKGRGPISLPAKPGYNIIPATDAEFDAARHLPFQNVLGVLCWLGNWVHVQALCIISMLGKCNAKWSKDHFDTALNVLVYLHGVRHKGIRWTKSLNRRQANLIYGYCDASFAMDETRRSRTGKCVFCNGGPIIVQSSLQKTISLSTMAAETIALSSTALDVCGLRTIMQEIGHWQPHPTVLLEDNQATVLLANSQATLSQQSKHLEIKCLKIRELVESGTIEVTYCRTTHMIADLMTKNLNSAAFPKFAAFICGYSTHDNVVLAILKDAR